MASKLDIEKVNTATEVGAHGDHDRVAMLSLRADGTPDQVAPEIIGDKGWAIAAAKEQFAQQAVSAADQAKRAEVLSGGAEKLEQDPSIAELKGEHDKAAEAAEKAAKAIVNELHKG